MKRLMLFALLVTSLLYQDAYGWNKDVFKTAEEECIYKGMMGYHSGQGGWFITVQERDGWYFFDRKMRKCKFIVPPKVRQRILDRCRPSPVKKEKM